MLDLAMIESIQIPPPIELTDTHIFWNPASTDTFSL